jgi:uncharacterized membrane protein YphA (DoxX/SURF4 family)
MTGSIVQLLAVVFLIAAISKLRSRDAFRAVLRGILPGWLVEPVAVLVPIAELALAPFLLSGIMPQAAAGAAVVMLGLFTVALAAMWWRGIKGCACFGESINNATTGSGIVRNIILLAGAFLVARTPPPVVLWGPDVSSLLGRLTIVAGAFCLWSGVLALANQRQIYGNDVNGFP